MIKHNKLQSGKTVIAWNSCFIVITVQSVYELEASYVIHVLRRCDIMVELIFIIICLRIKYVSKGRFNYLFYSSKVDVHLHLLNINTYCA